MHNVIARHTWKREVAGNRGVVWVAKERERGKRGEFERNL